MSRVAVLTDALIDKIAAGEVVERPASVVKELVENAIDAGSRSIRVGLQGGGMRLISVADDGQGMAREDAVLALTRHATSKLLQLEDLFQIRTMGFRGEALPAIAAVSRFSLVTSEPSAEVGTRVEVEGGVGLEVQDAAPVGGTRLRVEDLFFNTPARRKFLRSEQTELGHCEEAVVRVALAHPEVSFQLEHEGRSLFASAASPDLRERIAAALGAEVHRHLIPVEERRLGVSVSGHIARPDYNLSTARGIYTFVNRRYVRDRALNGAIQRAYSEILPGGRQPVVVLFIEVDPRDVDVNVHPQKIEVRFQDTRGVAEAVSVAIIRSLRELEASDASAAAAGASSPAQYAMAVERFLQQARVSTGDGSAQPLAMESPFAPGRATRAPAFGEARPGINEAPPPGFFSGLRFVGALARRFWLCEGPGGTLVIIDPHAAAERVCFHRFRGIAERQQAAAPTLFSATVDLAAPEAKRIGAGIDLLARMGVEVEPFGGTTFAVRALPPGLESVDAGALLTDLAAALPTAAEGDQLSALTPAVRVLACHGAKTAPVECAAEARAALFRELDGADFHLPCRHSQVVVTELPLLELERRARGLDR